MADRPPVQVLEAMGTVFSLDVRDPTVDEAAVERAFQLIREADERFSPVRPASELSRVVRGEVAEADASAPFREVMAFADDLARTSGGAFDVRRHRPDGRLDPSGLVKGWAAEAACAVLDAAGMTAYCLNAGGDVMARGGPAPGAAWRVGIRHPRQATSVAAVLAVRDLAVATSGTYERGSHIGDPRTGRPAAGWASLTVVGPSLACADAYATAAFVMGADGLAWVARQPGYGAYGISAGGVATWTPVVEAIRAVA